MAGTETREATAVPLSRLETSFAGLDAADARRAYEQSARAASKLLEWIGAPAVANILTEVGRGVPFAQAFERYAFMTYEGFQARIAAPVSGDFMP